MSKLQVIVGSTRPTKAAERVVPWVVRRASAYGAFEVELLDLRDWPLPMFVTDAFTEGGEPTNPLTDVSLTVVLEDLAWWSTALEPARAAGELTPGAFRFRALATAVAAPPPEADA